MCSLSFYDLRFGQSKYHQVQAFSDHNIHLSESELNTYRGMDKREAIVAILRAKSISPNAELVESIFDCLNKHLQKNILELSEIPGMVLASSRLTYSPPRRR
jgi:hypothetical protein